MQQALLQRGNAFSVVHWYAIGHRPWAMAMVAMAVVARRRLG